MKLWVLPLCGVLLGCVAETESPPPQAARAPRPHAEAQAPSVEDRARRLIEAMTEGRFEDATRDFDVEMKKALSAEALAETWKKVEAGAGPWKAVEKVEVKSSPGRTSVHATSRFERATLIILVNFDQGQKVAGLFIRPPEKPWSPPSYANASAFREEEVTVGTAPALPGTLTLPTSSTAMPAVVLVHGSGPSDRDETVGAIKVFKDLAWGLGSRGVVVLRYVKRSKHAPAGIVTQKEEVLDGAHDAIELLRHRSEVDPHAIYVIGHSQGAYLAPRIVKENPGVAGAVIMAGPTRSLQDVIVDQMSFLSSKNLEAAKTFKRTIEDPALKPDDDVTFPWGGRPVKAAYFLDMREYDPAKVAASLNARLLLLQGERDYQVKMVDFDGWKRGIGAKKGVTFRTYPALNHLFAAGDGPPNPAEYDKPGHVDETVVSDIASFVLKR